MFSEVSGSYSVHMGRGDLTLEGLPTKGVQPTKGLPTRGSDYEGGLPTRRAWLLETHLIVTSSSER